MDKKNKPLEVFSRKPVDWYTVDDMTEGSCCTTVYFRNTDGQECRKSVLRESEVLRASEHDPEGLFNACCRAPSGPSMKPPLRYNDMRTSSSFQILLDVILQQ